MTRQEAEKTVASWGKPLGLPSPVMPSSPRKTPTVKSEPTRRTAAASSSRRSVASSSSSSRSSAPVYMDLAYVPHHGDALYTDAEFFRRVRARYYVFSGVEPSREVFDALLQAKRNWEDKDLGELVYLVLVTVCALSTHNVINKCVPRTAVS